MSSNRRLYRNIENKMLAGVCAGLADYFAVDATIIRLLWVFLTLAGGAGILFYILAAIIIPIKNDEDLI